MKEISLTKGRHEIISPITGEEVTDSIWGETVENPLDIKSHFDVAMEYLQTELWDGDIVVYVTGLTPLFHAVVSAYFGIVSVEGGSSTFGSLIFAHYDRTQNTYVLYSARGSSCDWLLK